LGLCKVDLDLKAGLLDEDLGSCIPDAGDGRQGAADLLGLLLEQAEVRAVDPNHHRTGRAGLRGRQAVTGIRRQGVAHPRVAVHDLPNGGLGRGQIR